MKLALRFVSFMVLGAAAGSCGGSGYERGAAEPATGDGATAAPGTAAPSAPGDPLVIPRAVLEEARAAGAGYFMARLELSDVRDGARFIGWRVRPAPGGEAMFATGRLVPDDVVTRVNGRPLGKPDEFMFAWELATTASEIKVELLRGGAPLALSFRVR